MVFKVFNMHLMNDLMDLGLWDDHMKLEIIKNKGSIQNIERIPQEIRDLYKTVWEMSQRVSVDNNISLKDKVWWIIEA